MFPPEYFIVKAYVIDGGVVCRECGDRQHLPARDQITESEIYDSFGPYGVDCDDCGAEILAPEEIDEDDEDLEEDKDEDEDENNE